MGTRRQIQRNSYNDVFGQHVIAECAVAKVDLVEGLHVDLFNAIRRRFCRTLVSDLDRYDSSHFEWLLAFTLLIHRKIDFKGEKKQKKFVQNYFLLSAA